MSKFFWPIFLLFTFAVRVLFQWRPEWTEYVYSNGIFRVVRWVFDYLLGWLPFPLTYLLFGWVLWRLVIGVRMLVRDREHNFRQRLLRSSGQLFRFLCATITLFYWMWGFNYSRIPPAQKLGITEITLTKALLKAELLRQTEVVLKARLQVQPDTGQPVSTNHFRPDSLEAGVRQDVERLLTSLGYTAPGRVRGRQPFWDGFLLRFGASGIYNPFTGESNMDHALWFLSKPYVLAHEFCHGYGFGDEGICNFFGYLAVYQSDNALFRYSGELGYWREVAVAYRRIDPEWYVQFRAQLPGGFIADLDAIYQRLEAYPEFFAPFRRAAYDQYLKAQGIDEGLKNYDKVIVLVMSYLR